MNTPPTPRGTIGRSLKPGGVPVVNLAAAVADLRARAAQHRETAATLDYTARQLRHAADCDTALADVLEHGLA